MQPSELKQGAPEWKNFKLGKVSASRVADLMAKTKSGESASRKNYMMELLCERLTGTREEGFVTAAMSRGSELEQIARSAFEVDHGVMVKEVGCFVCLGIDSFIASPDGLVNDDGLLEIKCFNTSNHVEVLRTGKIDNRYQIQMLCQMLCTGRRHCFFVSFDDRLPDPLQYTCIRFDFDIKRADEILSEVQKFLLELDQLEIEMTQLMQKAA